MDINDVQDGIQDAVRTAQLTKSMWQDLPGRLKRWRSPKSSEPVDNLAPIRDLLRDNARDTVASLELTLEAAFHILGPDFESEDVMDPTWQKRWIMGVANVSADDEERRKWWACLLAGEIQNPGSYSLRTLSIMDNLSPTEAQLFSSLCSCVWMDRFERPVLIIPETLGEEATSRIEQQARVLEETGLVSGHALGYSIPLTKGENRRFQNGDLDLFVSPIADTRFGTGLIQLTTAGKEVLNLVEVVPDQSYVELVLAELSKHAKLYHAIRTQQGWDQGNAIEVESNEGEPNKT